jgi:hypothetical protein|tara:strand:+ start:102 stop:677 length:576 start_codon:yes stop_codon:yes gene_type:complete
MASFVEISSNALRLLGDDPIVSFGDDTERARLVNAIYEEMRDEVARAAIWNCCKARQILASLTETPAFGWAYYHQLPSNSLRVVDVRSGDIRIDHEVEGRKLMTDTSSVNLIYIKRVTDPNEFDALFVSAYTARIAAELALPITGSNTVANAMWQLYERKVREARTIDSQEGTPATFDAQLIVDARSGTVV